MLPAGTWHPAFWQTYRFVTDPVGYSREVIGRYGKTVRTRALNGVGIATADPEMIKLVFSADPDTFETVPVIGELFGPSAVIATSGSTHRRQRKLLNPRFHGTKMRAFLSVMEQVTLATFDAFERARKSGATIAMLDVAHDLTIDIILETVFGDSPGLDRAVGRSVLKDLVKALAPSLFAAPFLRSGWNPTWRAFTAARAAFDAMVDERVAERRAGSSLGGDLLAALLEARYEDGGAMEPAEIKDQLFTILIAGHETTAVTLSWAVYWLLREPDVLLRLEKELAKVDPPDSRRRSSSPTSKRSAPRRCASRPPSPTSLESARSRSPSGLGRCPPARSSS
jgi:cytochrome P450